MRMMLTTDGSEHSDLALQTLRQLPFPHDEPIAAMSIAHVPRPVTANVHQIVRQVYEEARVAELAASRERAAAAAQSLRQVGWKVREEVRSGPVADRILEFIRESRSELVFMGSRGLGTVSGWLLGSVSHAVVNEAPCSVWVARALPEQTAGEKFRILLATDGSDDAEAASDLLLQLGLGSAAEITVMTVRPGWPPEAEEQEAEAARDTVNRIAHRLRTGFSRVTTMVKEGGEAGGVILEAASESKANLIVVGSHGLTGIRRLLLGSVSQKVVTYAPCSVLVARRARK